MHLSSAPVVHVVNRTIGVAKSTAANFRFSPLVRSGQAEHVLGNIGKDEVRGNWRDLIETSLSKLTFNVVLGGETETAMGLQAHVGCLPRSIGRQQLGHVGLGPAWFA